LVVADLPPLPLLAAYRDRAARDPLGPGRIKRSPPRESVLLDVQRARRSASNPELVRERSGMGAFSRQQP
jgi:hypothetical protein